MAKPKSTPKQPKHISIHPDSESASHITTLPNSAYRKSTEELIDLLNQGFYDKQTRDTMIARLKEYID
ncbi:MAG: hypothetical protein LBN42_00550 [Oscillospiraceae bacterium]|jgi:hypothetical protein|nr:hypothetical protein [Oscillospiraceae bacterium]